MVESPRLKITYEQIRHIKGSKITNAFGTSYKKYGIDLIGYTIRKIWYMGKYIFIYLIHHDKPSYIARTHSMMYGKILINSVPLNPKLKPFMTWELESGDTVRWYMAQVTIFDPISETCTIKSNYGSFCAKEIIERAVGMMAYDISHERFDRALLVKRIEDCWNEIKEDILTDLLLDQRFFPGVGNILQQEALYRCRLLPGKTVQKAGTTGVDCLIDALSEVIDALYQSYTDKRDGLQYGPIFQIYHKAYCPLGHKTITKYLGYHNRRTTWCPICQK